MTEPHGEKSEREDSVMSEKIVQTAGRNALGEFAPEFAKVETSRTGIGKMASVVLIGCFIMIPPDF